MRFPLIISRNTVLLSSKLRFLPLDIFKSIKKGIAKRILSEKKEKWWTVSMCFTEIDNLRDKYSDENDEEKLKFLDELNEYVMSIQQKYENI